MKRTNYTQLPEVKELETILKKEAKRRPTISKENIHYPVFDSVEKWLEEIGIDTMIYRSDWDWRKTLVEGNKLVSEVVDKILKSNLYEDIFKQVTEYLGEEDKPQKSDLIFVFGSKSLSRIEKAVELYKKGFAYRIFITGGHPHYEKGESEAEVFKKYALKKSIPEKDILIDPKSITIADNVRRSLNLFDKWDLKYSSIILVTNWFSMRRSWAFMMKYIPESCKLYRATSEVNSEGDFAKDRWWENENGIKVIFNEFVKMKIGTLLNTC